MTNDLGNLIDAFFEAKEAVREAQQKAQASSITLLRALIDENRVELLKVDEVALKHYLGRR
jgi:hemoglobin-like flavoprotein